MPDIVARIAKYNNDTHRVAYYDIYENDTFTERLSPLRDSNNPE